MTLKEIISPMNFTLVRDSICELIAKERDNQIKLFQENNYDNDYIQKNINFIIFPKRFRYPSYDDLPCIFVYFNEAIINPDCQDIYQNDFNYTLNIEYFVGGINDESQEQIYTADENAEDRLNYLTAQLYKILCSEPTNLYQKTNNLVSSYILKKWERIIIPREINSTESILAAKFQFDLTINEETFYNNTIKIKEFYTKLNIRDEFIDSTIKKIL